MSDKIMKIPLDQIIPTEHNRRVIVEGSQDLQELAESIRTSGLIQPIICRRLPDGNYEQLAGRRRLEAHKILGLAEIEAIVRDLDDTDALFVTALENLRLNLGPMEEAAVVKQLLDTGLDAKDVAQRLGKGYVWVYRRANLVNLNPDLLASIRKCDLLPPWGAMHLEVLARMPQAVQKDLAEKSDTWTTEAAGWTAAQLEQRVMSGAMLLSAAPWKLGDSDWGLDAGCGITACTACDKRTDVAPELFHPENISQAKVKKDARCLSPVCWNRKKTMFARRQVADLRAEHGDKLLVIGGEESRSLGVKVDADRMSVTKVEKGTPGARPAVMLETGKVEYVKAGKLDTDAPKQAPLIERRKDYVVKAVIKVLQVAPCPWQTAEAAVACAAVFGTNGKRDEIGELDWRQQSQALGEQLPRLWDGVRKVLLRRLNSTDNVNILAAEASCVADLIGIDADALQQDAERDVPAKAPKPAAKKTAAPAPAPEPDLFSEPAAARGKKGGRK